MKIAYAKKFQKRYKRAPTPIQEAFKKRLKMFLKDPFDPVLNNHPLEGKFAKYRSINITGDWRALFEKHGEDVTYFVYLGTHSELYG